MMREDFRIACATRAGGRRLRAAAALAGALALLGSAGCAGQQKGDEQFQQVFDGGDIKPSQLQSRLMALGDEIIARVSENAEMVERGAEEIETRRLAHTLKLVTAEAAISNVVTPNPVVGLLDMVVMATLMRSRVEVIVPQRMPEYAESMVMAFERIEQDAWALADDFLTESQLTDLQRAIETWNLQNQDVRFVARIRLSEFANERLQTPSDGGTASLPSSVLDLVFLDPLSGLDPAVREIEQARLLAERISYQAQRMPRLVRWETEALFYDMATNPEISEIVTSFNEASTGIGRVGRLANEFPELVREERQQAIDQLTSSFFDQGRSFLESLEGSQEPLQETLASVESAATAGTKLASELEGLASQSRKLADQMNLGEESDPPDSKDGEDFTVEKFTTATAEVGQAADEVTRLLAEANELADQPVLDSPAYLSQMTEGTSDEFMDEVLETGLYLIGAGALALFLAITGALAINAHWARRREERHEHGWTH